MINIYKVLTEEEWQLSCSKGYVSTILDEQDGFIHFSSPKQLALTLYLYFKEHNKVVLLQINKKKIITKIVYEETKTGDRGNKFPHLYGKLGNDDISKSWNIERNAFELPEEVLTESENFN